MDYHTIIEVIFMFDPEAFVKEKINEIRARIPKGKKAVIAVSGGVDSTTAAVIASKALGTDLLAIYVDTGLMRKGEGEFVSSVLRDLRLNYTIVNAEEEFLSALQGVSDPEQKRKIIGEMFIRIFERIAKNFGAEYLIQGTIAPDWIESGDNMRDTIKTHHNVGGLPENIDLEVIEPLRDLYKDEVRKLATYLHVPVAQRQPFPGPGLAIRVLGPIDKEKIGIVREACAIVEEEIEKAYKQGEIPQLPWQYFAVLLPVKSVGVQGDLRAYGYTIVIRAVESLDAMTAQSMALPFKLLERMAIRITNTMGERVNRVVYDITHKPPGTIEWE